VLPRSHARLPESKIMWRGTARSVFSAIIRRSVSLFGQEVLEDCAGTLSPEGAICKAVCVKWRSHFSQEQPILCIEVKASRPLPACSVIAERDLRLVERPVAALRFCASIGKIILHEDASSSSARGGLLQKYLSDQARRGWTGRW